MDFHPSFLSVDCLVGEPEASDVEMKASATATAPYTSEFTCIVLSSRKIFHLILRINRKIRHRVQQVPRPHNDGMLNFRVAFRSEAAPQKSKEPEVVRTNQEEGR